MNRELKSYNGRNASEPVPAVAPLVLRNRIFYERMNRFFGGAMRVAFILLAALLVIKGSLFESYFIPTNSMLPTLRSSDFILVSKLSYALRLPFIPGTIVSWSQPARGDVIVFHRENGRLNGLPGGTEYMVKRVIGVPGDSVQVKGASVYINSELLQEPYALWRPGGQREDFGPVQVPAGRVFVLGDNRDESQDSRFWQDPFLDVDTIQGRAITVYWSSEDRSRAFQSVR